MTIFSRQQLDGLTGSGKGGSIGATGARQKPRQGFGSGGGMSLLGDPKQRQHRQQQQHQQNLEQWQKLSRARTQPIVPQGNTVDEMLKSLQKHPLYNDQNDRRLFHHVSNEYKRAYPGDVQYDEFGKMQRPKPAIQPGQIRAFDPDGVLGEGKSRARATQTARSFSAVTGLINEIDQAGHPERRETTQLQDLGQNLAQSIANIPHNQKMLREGRPEDRKTNPVQVLMGAATGAVGKAAGRFAKGKGASPLLVGLADKGASMAAGMVPGLVGSTAGAIGDAFSGDSGGSGQSAQAQLPNKPSVSMPHVDAPSDTMIGWGTGNTAQGPTWSLNKDTHQAMDAVPSAEHAASDMFTFAESADTLHGSESADDFRSAARDFAERITDMDDDDILETPPVPTQDQQAQLQHPPESFISTEDKADAIEYFGGIVGYDQAARALGHYRNGKGEPLEMPAEWLRGYSAIQKAETDNRSVLKNMITSDGQYASQIADLKDGQSTALRIPIKNDEIRGSWWTDLGLASGKSNLDTDTTMTFTRKGNQIIVEGKHVNNWNDIYDWHKGTSFGVVSGDELNALQDQGKAHNFPMFGQWGGSVTGRIPIGPKGQLGIPDLKWGYSSKTAQ